jgi:hypothetical protein
MGEVPSKRWNQCKSNIIYEIPVKFMMSVNKKTVDRLPNMSLNVFL